MTTAALATCPNCGKEFPAQYLNCPACGHQRPNLSALHLETQTKGPERPGGILILTALSLILGVVLIPLGIFLFQFTPFAFVLIIASPAAFLCAWGLWEGASWVYYVGTFNGGLEGLYFSEKEVRVYFGVDSEDEQEGDGSAAEKTEGYSGD